MFPHELVSKYLAPGVKALVALRLRSRGFGQERIARLLGVSQPMVSKYLKRRVSDIVENLARAGVDPEEAVSVADTLASKLARGDLQGYYALFTSFANTVLSRGGLCSLHRSHGAPADCNICATLFAQEEDPLVREVEEAARLVAATPGAGRLIPNVGSNIVAARRGATSIYDVVGLTGALVRVGDRAVIVGKPAYGGSRHTAMVLLKAMRCADRIRAAMVVAYMKECIATIEKHGQQVLTVGPHDSPEKLLEDIAVKLSDKRVCSNVGALVDLGGLGLEPVIYIFAETAVEAAEKALSCIREGLEG